MNSVIRQLLLHTLFPLIIGFLIYFFFRPNVWFVQFLWNKEAMISLTEMNGGQKLLIFSGPDFCWAYSLSSVLFIWHKWQGKPKKYFLFLIFSLIILSELIQVFFHRKFTLDWLDVIAAFLAVVLSYLLNYRNVKT